MEEKDDSATFLAFSFHIKLNLEVSHSLKGSITLHKPPR